MVRVTLPQYRGKTTAASKLLDRTPADIKDFWDTTAARPIAEVRPRPPAVPADAGDTAYVEAVRKLFAPRRTLVPMTPEATAMARAIMARTCANGCGRPGTHRVEGQPDTVWYCHNCVIALRLPWYRQPQPEPMPEEEVARRRALYAAEEAVRRWKGDAVAWDRSQPIFLTVPHRQDGLVIAKMVGKLDLVNVAMIRELLRDRDRIARKEEPTGAWRDLAGGPTEVVFFHAHTSSQFHRKLNCPAPLDTVVVDFLHRNAINWAFCYERRADADGHKEPGVLRFAPIHRFYKSPFAPETEYDERWRVYLGDDHWDRLIDVGEYKRHGDVKLHFGPERELILESPYIPQHQMVVLRRGKRRRIDE